MRIGVLTGGGDCPGLNAVIRAIVQGGRTRRPRVRRLPRRVARSAGGESRTLDVPEIRGILPRGGTILGSSRTNPFKKDGTRGGKSPSAGGHGSTPWWPSAGRIRSASPTASTKSTDADRRRPQDDRQRPQRDRLHLRLRHRDQHRHRGGRPPPHDRESHQRIMVVETMGRHAGWIAFHAGLAGGANVILIPELPFDLDRVCQFVGRRFEHQYAPILVVAEGAQPVGGRPETKNEKLDRLATSLLVGLPTGWRAKSRSGPARRLERRCSDMCSGAGPRLP